MAKSYQRCTKELANQIFQEIDVGLPLTDKKYWGCLRKHIEEKKIVDVVRKNTNSTRSEIKKVFDELIKSYTQGIIYQTFSLIVYESDENKSWEEVRVIYGSSYKNNLKKIEESLNILIEELYPFPKAHKDLINSLVSKVLFIIQKWKNLNTAFNELQLPSLKKINIAKRIMVAEDAIEILNDYFMGQKSPKQISAKKRHISRWMNEIKRLKKKISPGNYQRIKYYLKYGYDDKFLINKAVKIADNFIVPNLPSKEKQRTFLELKPIKRYKIYEESLKSLSNGTKKFRLQDVLRILFTKYEKVNKDLNIGIYNKYSIGTYKDHDYYAADINTSSGTPVYNVCRRRLKLPIRFNDKSIYNYLGSYIIPKQTRGTDPITDVFAKMAYGVGLESSMIVRKLFKSHKSENAESFRKKLDVEDLLARSYNPSEVPPEIGAKSDPKRLIASLTYDRVWKSTPLNSLNTNLPAVRANLLTKLEKRIKKELNIENEDYNVFQKKVVDGSVNSIGFLNSLTEDFIGEKGRDNRIKLIRAIRRIIRDDRRELDIGLKADNNIVYLVWDTLWLLKDLGAIAHVKGASITLKHSYKSDKGSTLNTNVFITHLSNIENKFLSSKPTFVGNGELIGEVGATGNAVSSHNHITIEVFQDKKLLGYLLPHEFYPYTFISG